MLSKNWRIVILLLLLSQLQAFAVGKELSGIKSLRVSIDAKAPKMTPIDKEGLVTTAELKLRMAGIVVKEVAPTDAIIALSIHVLKHSAINPYVYNLRGQCEQFSFLARDSSVSGWAESWFYSILGYCGAEELQEVLQKATSSVMDDFLNDYLSENPR